MSFEQLQRFSHLPMASFLSLPYEAREQVYRYCYDGVKLVGKTKYPHADTSRIWSWRSRPKLEFVCKKMRAECIPVRTAMVTVVVPAIMLRRERNLGYMTLIPRGLRRKLMSLEISDLSLPSSNEKVDVSALSSLQSVLVRRRLELRELWGFPGLLHNVVKGEEINPRAIIPYVKEFYGSGRWSDHGLKPVRNFRLHLTILDGPSKANVCFSEFARIVLTFHRKLSLTGTKANCSNGGDGFVPRRKK